MTPGDTAPEKGAGRPRLRFVLPLAVFLALVAMFGMGIGLDPSKVPSPFIGKQLPAFSARVLGAEEGAPLRSAPADMAGKAWVLNIWASWCASCLVEHKHIVSLARQGMLVVGLNHKDTDEEAVAWLERNGDPFRFSLVDQDGAIGLDLGVYGVPETFLVGPDGTVLHKHIGPVLEPDVEEILEKARAAEEGGA